MSKLNEPMSDFGFDSAKTYEELSRLLAPHGQQHLLKFWNELNAVEQQRLALQIREVDFHAIKSLSCSKTAAADWSKLASQAEPPQAFRLHDSNPPFSALDARMAGEQSLRRGEIGAILVAGGQGTRLGFDHPKGMYEIGPVSRASLFQILLEKLVAVGRRYGKAVPLYVMTSPATHDETVAYFLANQRFGISPENLHVFCQGQMPAVDAQSGKLLLAAKGELALSPDGHGGMLAALANSGGLSEIQHRDIKHLFYFQVDNPLVEMCDPQFLGYHILSSSEVSTLAISKSFPLERLGVVAQIGGRTRIIEYSDLPDDAAHRTNAKGLLTLWAGNTATHIFDVSFLDRASRSSSALPFHVARKKVPYLDENGRRIESSAPNAFKFERFIFDLLPLAEHSIVVEADRDCAFAPVKNAPGDPCDSPDTCQAAMVALYRRWLESAGAKIVPNVAVEISPLFALDATEVRAKVTPKTVIDQPTYLR